MYGLGRSRVERSMTPSHGRMVLALIVLAGAPTMAHAQALSCTGFLHGRDGSWRSLEDGAVLAPSGRVPITDGEIFRPTDRSTKGDIARALNDLCESH